jgi:hypothetical protein
MEIFRNENAKHHDNLDRGGNIYRRTMGRGGCTAGTVF